MQNGAIVFVRVTENETINLAQVARAYWLPPQGAHPKLRIQFATGAYLDLDEVAANRIWSEIKIAIASARLAPAPPPPPALAPARKAGTRPRSE